ncbi:hypothetical protein B0J13DRAFT_566572 [Dactylonectria estremocensis]|uniref:Uncharacterized protein n=1 Tax=Dactylonectria estremocensis TaxID=1079267 RepID=A0A9P9IK28_9HYPO|nr:hypothetical protein B0J13DRAFT_566572 [Dactylonectria estremocensis]
MAPIICKVVDSTQLGIYGVHATLEFKDSDSNTVKSESKSNHDGNVCWFPFPSPGQDSGLRHSTWVSLTFLPDTKTFPVPWVSIRTDIYLSAEVSHGFTLHLQPHSGSYRVEHIQYPLNAQIKVEMDWESSSPEDSMTRSPSPFQLLSPITEPRFRSTRSKGVTKRKRAVQAAERASNKRR